MEAALVLYINARFPSKHENLMGSFSDLGGCVNWICQGLPWGQLYRIFPFSKEGHISSSLSHACSFCKGNIMQDLILRI